MTGRHKAKEIVAKLRFVEKSVVSGRRISDCVGEIGVSEVTYYRWRNRFGGLEEGQAERLMELETEIAQLRRAVSDLTLDKLILVEATTGIVSPELRSAYVLRAKAVLGISERRACQALGQHRSTQRKIQARLLETPSPVCSNDDRRRPAEVEMLAIPDVGLNDPPAADEHAVHRRSHAGAAMSFGSRVRL